MKLYDINNIDLKPRAWADAGGCHCCQCSTAKRLTLISRVELFLLKMLQIGFSNMTKSGCGTDCRERLILE